MIEDKRHTVIIDGRLHLFGLNQEAIDSETLEADLNNMMSSYSPPGYSFCIQFNGNSIMTARDIENGFFPNSYGIGLKPDVGNEIAIKLQSSKDHILKFLCSHPKAASVIDDCCCSESYVFKWIIFHCICDLFCSKDIKLEHFSKDTQDKFCSLFENKAFIEAIETIRTNKDLSKKYDDIVALLPKPFDDQDWSEQPQQIQTVIREILALAHAEVQGGDFLHSINEAISKLIEDRSG